MTLPKPLPLLATLLLCWGMPSWLKLPLISSAATAQTAPADRKAEADRLLQQGQQQLKTGHAQEALSPLQQALEMYRQS